MRILKISPKGQITIPRDLRALCRTGYLSIYAEESKMILRPIIITEAQTTQEFLDELTHD